MWRVCQDFSLVLVLGLCGLALLQAAMGDAWWEIAITLALAGALLWCGGVIGRDGERRDDA
jgi:hypothetical protein